MTAQSQTKDELLQDIGRNWKSLHFLLSLLTEEQLTDVRDAQGWSAKDHVIHLVAWERSVVSYLQGKGRHEGLGVEESVYLQGGFDEINDVIYRQRMDLPLGEVMAQFDAVHQQLLALLEPLTDEDLQKPYIRKGAGETGDTNGSKIYDLIHGNSAGHYEEHETWIEALFDPRGG